MDNFPAVMAEKIENQLAQLILYIGAIDSLSEAYQTHENLRQDAFLFSTVYDGLWDAAIVRIGTLWDNTGGVASLPKLTKHLRRLNGPEAKAVATEIDGAATPEWIRLKEWRHAIVAHVRIPLDAPSFDRDNSVGVTDLRKETERVEHLLARANKCLGREQVYYEALKEDAVSNARNSLARWTRVAA